MSMQRELDALCRCLETEHGAVPWSGRASVTATAPVRSIALGLVPPRASRTPVISRATYTHAALLARALAVARASPEPLGTFTSIAVNVQFGMDVHRDSHNEGPSWTGSCGDFRGGSLWVEDAAAPPDVPGGACLLGREMGRCLETKGRLVAFDGRLPHRVLPYAGFRVSVVFFATVGWRASPDLHDLAYLGFPVTPEGEPVPARLPFVVAVPSHGRARGLVTRTLRVLQQVR